MAVVSAVVTLLVNSTETTPEQISDVLGLDPTYAGAAGTVTATGRVRGHASWTLDVESSAADQAALDDALGRLAETLSGRQPAIDHFLTRGEVSIWCTAESDSGQGGFWLSPETLAALGRLRLPLYVTVWTAES